MCEYLTWSTVRQHVTFKRVWNLGQILIFIVYILTGTNFNYLTRTVLHKLFG